MDSPSRDSPSKSTPTSSSSRFLASRQWSSSSNSDSYGSSSSQSTTTSRYSPSSNGSASKYGGNDADNDDENGSYNSGNANSNGNSNSGSNSNNNNGGNSNSGNNNNGGNSNSGNNNNGGNSNSGNNNNGGNNNSGNNNNGGDNNNDNSDNSNGGNNNGNGGNNNNNNGNNNKNNGGNNNNDNNSNNNNNNNGKNNSNDNKNNNNNNNNSSPPNNKPWKPPPTPPSKSPPSNHAPRALGPPPPAGNPPPSPSNDGSSTTIIIIAVAVAAGIGLFLCMSIIICCLCRRRKKEAQIDQMQYYNNPDKATTEFFKGANQRRNSYNDQMSNLAPPPGHMPHNGGWQTPPPPPGMSSDMSSNFSGPHGPVLPPPHPSVALGFNQSTFTYEELSAATGGFSQANLLGQGGFGFVHKGTLPNGKEVAVKSLKSGSGQGEREFQAEVEIISRVHHRHLVSLVGYCIAGGQRMLVYEFLPNNNLEYHLHGNGHAIMDWPTRHKIALGSAKGLAYLHEDCHPRIIHRDIKTANILLDENCEAKVADFGLAKLSSDNYTHVSTRIMGTFGYLAPEYASSGKLTEKSDVFSFGVMLLELITGKRPVDPTNPMEDSLVDWARPLLLQAIEDGNCDELADPKMERNYDAHEMQRMIACAAASIRHSAKRRPKMSQIVRALEGDSSLEDLNDGGIKPGQAGLVFSGMSSSRNASSDYDNVSYNEDLKKFRKLALESGDMSNEFGITSEYSANPSASGSEYDSRGQSPQTRLQHQNKNLPPLC